MCEGRFALFHQEVKSLVSGPGPGGAVPRSVSTVLASSIFGSCECVVIADGRVLDRLLGLRLKRSLRKPKIARNTPWSSLMRSSWDTQNERLRMWGSRPSSSYTTRARESLAVATDFAANHALFACVAASRKRITMHRFTTFSPSNQKKCASRSVTFSRFVVRQ